MKTRLGQGRENARTFLLENSEICEEVEKKVKVALGIIKPKGEEKATVADK